MSDPDILNRKSSDTIFQPASLTGEENKAYLDDISVENGQPPPDYKETITKRQSSNDSSIKVVGEVTSSITDSDEGEVRDVWDSQLEFLLSCISMSVGLGNVWRFPYTAYKNGGGAFLIPYLIILTFIGRPIYYLEMCIGQFTSFGPTKVWSMIPFFKGIGYCSTMAAICVVSYYCSLMALTVFYFIASFAKTVPWANCKDEWNDIYNGIVYCENGTYVGPNTTSTSQLYYEIDVFPQYDNIDGGLGAPEWRLTLCLAFSWAMVMLSLIKGVKSSGKVAYFTAIFPYFVLFILLIRGVTLKGAGDGIRYLFEPQWDKLLEPDVWFAAVGQCLLSLNTGFGTIIMFSSYNPFRHNIYKDALILSVMDTFTSLIAGITIFAVLGNLAYEQGVPVDTVAKAGPGLAFISYPDAIAKFDWVPQLFAVLFFLMLFTLGVGSATSVTGGVITVICDQFPKLVRWQVTVIVCSIGFLAGLMYVTPGGQFMLTLVDNFGASFVIFIIVMVEVGAISYIYGLNNFCRDLEFMLNIKVGWYWKFSWGFFIPVGLFAILMYWLVTQEEITHEDAAYPSIAIVCGWLLSAFVLSLVPFWGIQAIMTRKSATLKEKFFEAFRPSKNWGPKHSKDKREWEDYKNQF